MKNTKQKKFKIIKAIVISFKRHKIILQKKIKFFKTKKNELIILLVNCKLKYNRQNKKLIKTKKIILKIFIKKNLVLIQSVLEILVYQLYKN